MTPSKRLALPQRGAADAPDGDADAGPFALERLTTPERIAIVLRRRIADGVLAPGARLVETEFTQAFGVSRHTFREAISILVGDRLLRRTSFKGVEVVRLTAADVRDIYRARRAIELPAVDALAGAGPEVLAGLDRAVDRLVAVASDEMSGPDSESVHLADAAVHAALVAAHGSRRLGGLHATLMAELHILLFKTYGAADARLAVDRHTAFQRLVAARDFAGARAQLDARLRASEDQMALGVEQGCGGPARR